MRIVRIWFMGWFIVLGIVTLSFIFLIREAYIHIDLWDWSIDLWGLHWFICCTWSMRLSVVGVVEAFHLGLFRRSYLTQKYTFEVLVGGYIMVYRFLSSWFLPGCSWFGEDGGNMLWEIIQLFGLYVSIIVIVLGNSCFDLLITPWCIVLIGRLDMHWHYLCSGIFWIRMFFIDKFDIGSLWLQFKGCICSWHEFDDVSIPWRYGWLDVLACVVDVIFWSCGFFSW